MSCAKIGARICFVLAFILIAIAFSTPYWLQSDGLLPYQRFHKVGLWEICYTTYQESSYLRYNNNFRNCRWIFDRDYYYLIDLFETGHFAPGPGDESIVRIVLRACETFSYYIFFIYTFSYIDASIRRVTKMCKTS